MPVWTGLGVGKKRNIAAKKSLQKSNKKALSKIISFEVSKKWLRYENSFYVQTFKTICFLPYFNHLPLPLLPLPQLRLRLLPVQPWKLAPLPQWGLLPQWFLAQWEILLLLAGAVQECGFLDCICDPSQSRCSQISWEREVKDHMFTPRQNISRETIRHPYSAVQEVTAVQISYSRRILNTATLFNCPNGY